MAESPSSALPGGVQWLPAIGGAHLLRAEVGRGEPPTLVLQSQRGGEHRIAPGPQTRFSRSADFLIPAGLRWSLATLVWSNGARAVLPDPPASRAEVIDLASRRPAPAVPPPASESKPAPLPWTAVPWDPEPATPESPGSAAPTSAAAPGAPVSPAASALPADAASPAAAPTSPTGTTSRAAVPASPASPAATASPAGATSPASVPAPPASPAGATSPAAVPAPPASPAGATSPSSASAPPPAPAETAIPASRAAEVTGADGYETARADLQADLSRAVEALSHAQETEAAADDAVQALISGARSDLQAERAARAADLTVLGAQSQLIAMRAELERARDEITQLRTALESERLARTAAEAALGTPVPPGALTELATAQTEASAAAKRRSPEEADRLVVALEAAASSLRASIPVPKDKFARAAQPVRSETLAERTFATAPPAGPPEDAAPTDELSTPAESLPHDVAELEAPSGLAAPHAWSDPGGTTYMPAPDGLADLAGAETPDGPADPAASADPDSSDVADDRAIPDAPVAEIVIDHRPVIVASVAARAAEEAARHALAPVVVPAPGLRRALVTLAHEEPLTAAALIAGMLPAQAALLDDEPLSYDLTVRGYGTFAVTIGHGGTEVQRLTKRRSRKQAAFHVSGEPVVLAQLLAGERKRLGRFKPSARITGRRKHARALCAALPTSTLSLADAVAHGARLEPALVYAALPYAVAPEWTKGHVFTIAQEIRELGPRAWYVTARDGVRLSVVEHSRGAAADATVTMSRAAFDRLLMNEPPAPGDLPVIRGNREAVAALKRWTDLARG